ncbi:MAG: tRNA 2-selenouridine(34) synthase MnmH [Chitinophagaceae bacterium]|nr:tRNA 2-selenouridine(34) synthase MnmH [Chitinophagaceae bacterium]
MPIEKIHIEQFTELADLCPVLDVRSPSEYNHAHIPGAFSLPLFTDEERKIVGTTYKQKSREAAIKTGLDLFGPKMRKMLEEAEAMVSNWKSAVSDSRTVDKIENSQQLDNRSLPTVRSSLTAKCVLVHCWRGGMRSAGVAWLLDLYGFKVYTLIGGYKAYRNHVLQTFNKSYNFNILGGYTGSGKTIVLKELEKSGEQMIDLEALASHKGSAFGAIAQPAQPSQEMFENLLGYELRKKSAVFANNASPGSIWLEDESQRIGLINAPQSFWEKMRRSPVYFMEIPFEKRLIYVVDCYGKLDKEKMVNAIIRIRKRLGGLETKTAINFLLENNIEECFRILLKYYDKYYLKGLNGREDLHTLINTIVCEDICAVANAQAILAYKKP